MLKRSFSTQIRKPKVVVLGSGWGGFQFLHNVDRKKYDVTCVSPRNHFLFTPLLPSTTVGTLEFRSIIEPVRTLDNLTYHQAFCEEIDIEQNFLRCKEFYRQHSFSVPFDHLIISVGAEPNTFGLRVNPDDHAFFLKNLADARGIRQRLIECFERAAEIKSQLDGLEPQYMNSSDEENVVSEVEIKRLLTFVCVGGGPTSVEFAAELSDFIRDDVSKWYPDLKKYVKISVIEATDHILSSFDAKLSSYAVSTFQRHNIEILTNTFVKDVQRDQITIENSKKEKQILRCGLIVWSTGLAPTRFVLNLNDFLRDKRSGRLLTNQFLQVMKKKQMQSTSSSSPSYPSVEVVENVYALGDCAAPIDQTIARQYFLDKKQHPSQSNLADNELLIQEKLLPATAQVASQQASFLATYFNKNHQTLTFQMNKKDPLPQLTPFIFNPLGMLTYTGDWTAISDLRQFKGKGFGAFVIWRSAYLTKLVSWKNKILVPMFWFKSWLFGRDISRF